MNRKPTVEDIYPLSPTQQDFLFLTLSAPASGMLFEQVSVNTFWQKVTTNIGILRDGWQYVIRRHPVLRTGFVWEGLDEPLQVVYKDVSMPVTEYDLRGMPATKQEQQINDYMQNDQLRGFDLSSPPLMRMAVFHLDDDEYEWIWSYHHLLMDGWSTTLVWRELAQYADAVRSDQTPAHSRPRTYRDYIAWLRRQDLSDAESYWRDVLEGFTRPVALDVSRATGGWLTPAPEQASQQVRLSASTTEALQSLVSEHRLTLNTLTQGAWALLLWHYSGQEDIVFGTSVSGRSVDLQGVQSIVGVFVNTLPVRARIVPRETVLSWLKRLNSQIKQHLDYEYTPMRRIRAWSGVPRGSMLFETKVNFMNFPHSDEVTVTNQLSERVNYPMVLEAEPGERLSLRVLYHRRCFDDRDVSHMLANYQTLLQAMATAPQCPLWGVTYRSEAERSQVFVGSGDTAASDGDRELVYVHETIGARAGTEAHILNAYLQPVPIGVYGELYLDGAGLTQDHHNGPAETAARFIPNPFATTPGARLYRTGTVARVRADGTLERPAPDEQHSSTPAPDQMPADAQHADAVRIIREIWRDVLEVEQVGHDDDFFALGGGSLHAVQLQQRLRAAFDADISITDIFTYPTVAGLAQRVTTAFADNAS